MRMTILPPVVLTNVPKAGSATLVVLSIIAIKAPAPLLSKIKALAGAVKNSSEQSVQIEPTPSKINCSCLLEKRIRRNPFQILAQNSLEFNTVHFF